MPPEDLAQALLSCPGVEGTGTEAIGGGLMESIPQAARGQKSEVWADTGPLSRGKQEHGLGLGGRKHCRRKL